MTRPRHWKKDDRLVHRQTGKEAIVLEFHKDKFFHSNHYCKIQLEDGREEFGDWGMIREDWQLKPGRGSQEPSTKITIRVPNSLLEKVDAIATEKGCDRTTVILKAIAKL